MTKYFLPIFVLICFVANQGLAQVEYTLDTGTMSIIETSGPDTILFLNENNNLKTQSSLRVQSPGSNGDIRLRAFDNPQLLLRDSDGHENFQLFTSLNGSGAAILMSDIVNGDTNTIRLVTNFSGTNDARVVTDEIQINGGSDLAEMFEVNDHASEIQPGLLVSLDENSPGELKITQQSYDKKIAGIISGANGVKPGILMGQKGSSAFGDDLITLSGRTYVKANNLGGPIKVGDFLTSSPVKGEAMRARNARKARGSIIGKAMTPLEAGSDFVLVLVNLQ